MLETTCNHLLDNKTLQSLESRVFLVSQFGELSEVADVHTPLVQEVAQRLAVHWEADFAILELLDHTGNDL